jgi:adenylate cyclase
MGRCWLPRIGFGTEGYSEKVARRLAVNIAAWSVASAVGFFAVLRFIDPRPEMLPRAIINALAAIVLASIPLLHRFGSLAAPLTLIVFVYAFLIYVVTQIGMDGGSWLTYLFRERAWNAAHWHRTSLVVYWFERRRRCNDNRLADYGPR